MGKSFHKIREDFEKNSSSMKDRKKKLPGLHSAADSFSTIDSLDSLEPVQNQFWIQNDLLNTTVDPQYVSVLYSLWGLFLILNKAIIDYSLLSPIIIVTP